MANQNQLFSPQPIEVFEESDMSLASGVPTNTAPHCPPPDILKLQKDVLNVFEGRVDISTFEPEYQERIKNYYKFSATQCLSSVGVVAKRTRNTLDIV